MAALIIGGASLIVERGNGFYMGLILVWVVPFALMLWYVLMGYRSRIGF